MKTRSGRLTVKAPGGRLDQVLVSNLPQYSRSRIQRLIRNEHVSVNGELITKPGARLEGGEVLEFHIPAIRESHLLGEDIPLVVLYEDEHLIVIDKPAGMVVHPAAGHASGTLVNALLGHAPNLRGVGDERRPGVVHRLDKDTSGVIVFAKDDETHRFLRSQFNHREVKKTYLALVDGAPKTTEGKIDAPIGRSRRDRKKMAVVPVGRGRSAVTIFRVLERFEKHSFVEVHPISGRTHQIRVHLAHIGVPIVGDRIYGRKRPSLPLQRPFLHASVLAIRIPGEEEAREFQAALPDDLEATLKSLRMMEPTWHENTEVDR